MSDKTLLQQKPLAKRIRTSPTGSKKSDKNAPPKKKKKTCIIRTSAEDYKIIDEILGYKVMWNAAIGHAVGYCSLTNTVLPFAFFPVLTREPPKSEFLPHQDRGDRGYFAGADKPSTIRIALIQAFLRIYPEANPVKQPWVNWEVWKNNLAYYTAPVFNAGPGAVEDIRDQLLNSYPFGGAVKTREERLARTCIQKRFQTVVSAKKFFAELMPAGLPEGATFMPYDYLFAKNAELKVEKDKLLLDKKQVVKAVKNAEQPDDESDDDDDSGSENGSESSDDE